MKKTGRRLVSKDYGETRSLPKLRLREVGGSWVVPRDVSVGDFAKIVDKVFAKALKGREGVTYKVNIKDSPYVGEDEEEGTNSRVQVRIEGMVPRLELKNIVGKILPEVDYDKAKIDMRGDEGLDDLLGVQEYLRNVKYFEILTFDTPENMKKKWKELLKYGGKYREVYYFLHDKENREALGRVIDTVCEESWGKEVAERLRKRYIREYDKYMPLLSFGGADKFIDVIDIYLRKVPGDKGVQHVKDSLWELIDYEELRGVGEEAIGAVYGVDRVLEKDFGVDKIVKEITGKSPEEINRERLEIESRKREEEKRAAAKREEVGSKGVENKEEKSEGIKSEEVESGIEGRGVVYTLEKYKEIDYKKHEYESREDLINDILKDLLTGNVYMEIEGSKGEVIRVVATRSVEEVKGVKLRERVNGMNTQAILMDEIARGRIKVVDLITGKMLEIRVDKIKAYVVKGKQEGVKVGWKDRKEDVKGVDVVTVEKEYKGREEVINDVLIPLLKGRVELEFIKANGELRYMEATRNLDLVSKPETKAELAILNTRNKLEEEVERGTLSVIDLEIGEHRRFVVDRLQYFKEEGSERIKVIRLDGFKEDEAEKHFDPTKLSTEQLIEILGKKVVRLVFKKKDGTVREMVATRDSELVELYENVTEGIQYTETKRDISSEEAIRRQVERDYVTVFDIGVGEFRTFKPSTLERYDVENGVASWIEFTKKNDAWFDIARLGNGVKQYYQEGKRNAKNIGSVITERVAHEKQRRQYLEDLAAHRQMIQDWKEEKERVQREEKLKEERRDVIREVVLTYVKENQDTVITERQSEIFKELMKISGRLKNNTAFRNLENEVTQEKVSKDLQLVVLQVGRDVLYMHPEFIVNAYSGRVYADKTEGQIFSGVGKVFDSDADWGMEEVLKPVVDNINGVRRSRFSLGDGVEERADRILVLAKEKETELRKLGVLTGKVFSNALGTHVLRIGYKGNIYLIHPNMVVTLENERTKVIFKVSRPTSRGVEYEEFFKDWLRAEKTKEGKKVVSILMRIVITANDLRKRVQVGD